MRGNWNEQKVDLVKARWADGLSATEIMRELGGEFSRNAVIGKIHRLGLSGPNSGGGQRIRATLPRSKKHVSSAVFVPRLVDMVKPEAIGPQDDFPAAGCCRWIDNHPAIQSWRCCGQPGFIKSGTKTVLPYCEYHWILAHQQKLSPAPVEAAPERLDVDETIGSGRFLFTKGHHLGGQYRKAA